MTPSESGEGRIRGYLYLLKQSLRSFMPEDLANDSVREVESHIRESLAELPDDAVESESIERVLARMGPPLELARVYASEYTLEEAATTARVAPLFRALWLIAATTVSGFFKSLVYFIGYSFGIALLAMAPMKLMFPDDVGLVLHPNRVGFGFHSDLPEGAEILGGYEVIPISLALGMLVLIVIHRAARRTISRFRQKRERWRFERDVAGSS